ncbi:hypothetical protein [Gordonia hydrophobica]|uniref:Uncharacterized protein n=1 Tax=Gordonia hydrophobica TaxID=40516 RepID=A0ABZ2U771_9ACTN|nr:hypothetical protein [Gordonia hydrophobica]MBM7366151.1 hypothetical protein [Gordonia hydrophobica]
MSSLLITVVDGDHAPTSLTRRVAGLLSDSSVTRLIVSPGSDSAMAPDAFLARVVAALMKLERLDVEVAYVAPRSTRATRNFGLPHGAAAERLATTGTAHQLPLIRDDAATVLVGRARHLGADGAALHGECIADSDTIFNGDARGVEIEPLPSEPGVRGRLIRRLPGGWKTGRAVQTGGTNVTVEREGELTERVVKRSTFYRHHVDWHLVRP